MQVHLGMYVSCQHTYCWLCQPRYARQRLPHCVLVGGEDPRRVAMQRKPPSHVLGVPAEFLKTDRTVIAHKNIDAVIPSKLSNDATTRLPMGLALREPGRGRIDPAAKSARAFLRLRHHVQDDLLVG